ncbi:low-density lipoprotein receptor-related protein 6-like [Antedon mediterranea]|uniref:low-density lipoprotein receptor-related protein 6-like n=1 Tax=Antedon mediterranea TaxID=105859 RepID=UPI003AF5384A
MSYDPYNQMIFWSCKINNEVNVIRVDGTTVGTIIDGPNQKPRNLALMPVKGLIFWTNMLKRYPKLMQARIDGSNQQELVTGLYRPGPIAADAQSNRIYWFDSRLKAIEYFEIDTGTRHRLITESIENVGGLTLDGYFVYWVRNKFIERADKQTGENNQTLLKSNGLLTDVLTVKKPQYSSQPCSNMKGLCSHFCILTHVRTTRCSCPPNMILDNDEHNCIEPPTCAPDHFNCLSGYIACIPSEWVCDGNSECSDGSDELGCSI